MKVQSNDKKALVVGSSIKKKFLVLGIGLYITFILLSTFTYIAETHMRSVQDDMEGQYLYHLYFTEDGSQSHYYAELVDDSKNGEVSLVYTTKTNSLNVETKNIKKLEIDCESVYNDESIDVFKIAPDSDEDYCDSYFISRDTLMVTVISDHQIELRFKYAPIPYEVYVDDSEWWRSETGYTYENDEIVVQKVPKGVTVVKIFFEVRNPPKASFNIINEDLYLINGTRVYYSNEEIIFDATDSVDGNQKLDGEIIKYKWYFDDDTFGSGKNRDHIFKESGTYKVTLTVINNFGLRDNFTETIMIINSPKESDSDSDRVEVTEDTNPLNGTDEDSEATEDLFLGLPLMTWATFVITIFMLVSYTIYLNYNFKKDAENSRKEEHIQEEINKLFIPPERKMKLKFMTKLWNHNTGESYLVSTIPKELFEEYESKRDLMNELEMAPPEDDDYD